MIDRFRPFFEHRYAVEGSPGVIPAQMDRAVEHPACKTCGQPFIGPRAQKRCDACRPAAVQRRIERNDRKLKERRQRKRQQGL